MIFLSPWLLTGLVLAGVPVLIHLLNRRRFTVVEWAPMKYLKLTIRSNRRRMQIEQLLLLALRTLLMILIVLTVARLALARSGLGGWMAKRSRVSRVIVLDNSLSMGYRIDGKVALDLGKQAAAEILRSSGSQDAMTFLTTTPASTPLVREVAVDNPGKLISEIDALQTTEAAANWAGTFKAVDDCLSTATFPQKQLVLITDLRRNGWSAEVTDLANRWARQGVEARIVDVGNHATANVSLLKFVQEDPLALPNAPLQLMASVRNQTMSPLNAAQAVLTVDGEARPIILPDVPAGATIDVPMSVIFASPGQHQLRLALPDDALNADNLRFLNINVREKLDLTLVDGREGAGAFESASDFLQVAFSVGQEPWHVQKISDTDPRASRPVISDVTVLVNAANLTPTAVTQYEKLVNQGMGLMIFAGEQLDPSAYNDLLYKDGRGLLPARLDRVVDGPVKGLVVEGFGDSPLGPLAKIAPAALAKITTRRLLAVEMPVSLVEGVRVLARWNDPEGHPAIIEKRVGRGHVLLWTTTADREWTDWPVDPTYVLAVRSAAVATAWPDTGSDNIVAGHELIYQPADDQPRQNPRLTPPENTTPIPLADLRSPHTEHAGVYTIAWNDPAGKEQQHQLAVSFDRTASELDLLPQSQLQQLLGKLRADVVPYHPGQLASAGSGKEIWRTLAAILLALMFVESLLAFYVGRER